MTTLEAPTAAQLTLTPQTRASHPNTSFHAAASVKKDTVAKTHKAVLDLLRSQGSMPTWQAVHELSHEPFSPSRIRSSFPELERLGYIERVGETESQFGRTCALWALKERV